MRSRQFVCRGVEDAEGGHRHDESAEDGREVHGHVRARVVEGVPEAEEERIEADADFHGGRDVEFVAFLHEHGHADEEQFEQRKQRVGEQL